MTYHENIGHAMNGELDRINPLKVREIRAAHPRAGYQRKRTARMEKLIKLTRYYSLTIHGK